MLNRYHSNVTNFGVVQVFSPTTTTIGPHQQPDHHHDLKLMFKLTIAVEMNIERRGDVIS